MDITELIGIPLAALLRLCQSWLGNYLLAILLFTLLTKVILLPISLWVQRNSIRLVALTPELNRMKALALLGYYAQGRYAEVIRCMQEVDPDMLAGKERDDLILAYALSMIEEERCEEAAVQLGILNLISDCYDNEVAFYTAYTDYKGQRYEAAEQGFAKTQNVAVYHRPSRYYLAEIMLQTKGYVEAEKMAADYIDEFQNDEYTLEMTRVQGEALYAQKRYLQEKRNFPHCTNATEIIF